MIRGVAEDKLEALIKCPQGERTGDRLRTLAIRLYVQDKEFQALKTKAGAAFKQLIIDAACGTCPAHATDKAEKKKYKAHSQDWLKSEDGGAELFSKAMDLGVWPALKAELLPFCNAVRKAVGLGDITDLKP